MKVLKIIDKKLIDLTNQIDDVNAELRIASKLDFNLEIDRLNRKQTAFRSERELLNEIKREIETEIEIGEQDRAKKAKDFEKYVNASDNDSRSGDARIEESAFNPPDEKKLVYTRDNPFREVD